MAALIAARPDVQRADKRGWPCCHFRGQNRHDAAASDPFAAILVLDDPVDRITSAG